MKLGTQILYVFRGMPCVGSGSHLMLKSVAEIKYKKWDNFPSSLEEYKQLQKFGKSNKNQET